jgi:hypothetical protein
VVAGREAREREAHVAGDGARPGALGRRLRPVARARAVLDVPGRRPAQRVDRADRGGPVWPDTLHGTGKHDRGTYVREGPV